MGGHETYFYETRLYLEVLILAALSALTPRRRCTTTSTSLPASSLQSVNRISQTFKAKAWRKAAPCRQFQRMTPSLDGPHSCFKLRPIPSLLCEGLFERDVLFKFT